MIKNASDDDDDAYVITNLAREWGARLPYLAELKLFKDGREMVDANSVPQGTDPNAAPVYKLMRQLGVVNLARRISESVTDRQQPNGFRKVEDSSLKDTDADRMAKQCGLNFILRRNPTARYGELHTTTDISKSMNLIYLWMTNTIKKPSKTCNCSNPVIFM